MDTIGAIVGPLTALWLLAALPGNYRAVFAITFLPGLIAAALIGFAIQERKRIPVLHASFAGRLRVLPKSYRRLLLAVGIFGAGAFAHTLLILWAAQRLTPSLGSQGAARAAVGLYVPHNIFYAAFSYIGGLLADRFPKSRLLAGGYALAALMALGIMFLPVSLGLLALVFMLGGVQVAIEEPLRTRFARSWLIRRSMGWPLEYWRRSTVQEIFCPALSSAYYGRPLVKLWLSAIARSCLSLVPYSWQKWSNQCFLRRCRRQRKNQCFRHDAEYQRFSFSTTRQIAWKERRQIIWKITPKGLPKVSKSASQRSE